MKLGTVTKRDTNAIAEIPRAEVRVLWVNDVYDIPLLGMAEVGGNRYLFKIIDLSALDRDDESGSYWLIALTPEELRDEERWHDLFCRKVGTHFDFTGRPAPSKEEICFDEFYVPFRLRAQPDYANNEVIGWFRNPEATAAEADAGPGLTDDELRAI
jgi:hypothetical protein